MNPKYFQAKVTHGEKRGLALGFPTLNLDNPKLLLGFEKGVYAAKVNISKKIYGGLLYFGPRLIFGEKNDVLEIFVLDFKKEIYGKTISFQLIKYLRPPEKFVSHQAYRKQLNKDVGSAKEILLKLG